MKFARGFTLIELLIALAVFAVIATITASSMYYAFNTRARVNKQADRVNALQLTWSIIERDTLQIIQRPVRSNEMRLFPIFVGQMGYMEFTRDGNVNPDSTAKRSTLKRIALVCQNNQLIRRTWETLDPIDHNTYKDKILLKELKSCSFKFLNRTLQVLTEWREQAVTQNQRGEPLPTGIQVNLTLTDWGEMNLLFLIPGARYAEI